MLQDVYILYSMRFGSISSVYVSNLGQFFDVIQLVMVKMLADKKVNLEDYIPVIVTMDTVETELKLIVLLHTALLR